MNTTANILVVVDGYSSGSQLPAVMREHGWSCLHVTSVPAPAVYFLTNFRYDDYIDHVSFDGDVDVLAQVVAKYSPKGVAPGTESGVFLADLLARALGLPGNDPATSVARRDKYAMHNRLKVTGLRSMDHFLARELDELLAWGRQGRWPVVVKPPASAGTDSVAFCDTAEELAEAFHRVLGATNQLGDTNEAVLAQRFLVGQEYFINGLSGDGKHVITEIWRADKIPVPGASFIYDKAVLFDPQDPKVAAIARYVHQVLDALGVRYGANHTEVMVTEDGPTLIECASRLSGGLSRAAANFAVGVSQLDMVGNLITEGTSYVDRVASEWRTNHPLWQTQLISDRSGTVTESHYNDLAAALGSRTWIQKAPKPGDTVVQTTDLFSSPGIIFMSSPDPEVLQADHETIRRWEREDRLMRIA